MKFGLITGPVYPPVKEMSTAQAVETGLKMSVVAQRHGFEGLTLPQHYLAGPLAQELSPLVYGGYLAAACPGMYLATSIIILPLEKPVAIAEQVATLDAITGGRFLFGVGQGYRQIEFDSMQVPLREKAPRMVEACKLIKQLWTGEEVNFEGQFYRVPGATATVVPSRVGGPPIMVGGDAAKSIARIPEFADHWIPSARHSRSFLREMLPLYKASLTRVGRKFDGLPMTRDVAVGRSREEALDFIKSTYQRQFDIQKDWKQPGEDYEVSIDKLIQDRMIAGTPDEVAEELIRDHEEFGTDFVWARMYLPGADFERCLDMIKLMGDQVIPKVQARVGSGSIFEQTW